MTGVRGGERCVDPGVSCLDLVLGLAIAAVTAAMTMPLTAHVLQAARGRAAARFVGSVVQRTRLQALAGNHSVALVFEPGGSGWVFRICDDDDGDGVRRADIASGDDRCRAGAEDVGRLFSGARVAIDPTLPGPDGEPGSSDPVRLGRSEMLSCAPAGTCTAGTVFVRSSGGDQYAVRVNNVTGRTRILRFNPGTGEWEAS